MTTDDFTSRYQQHAVARRLAAAITKEAVFDALAAANITSVTVEFDGEGDSGGIEQIAACAQGVSAELPTGTVVAHQAKVGSDVPVVEEQTLREAIESLCYDYLAQDHDGWENNDGAFGTFEFTVATRTIELGISERFTDFSTSTYEF